MKYILRKKSILDKKESLEHLHTFKNFPVFMGCTNDSEDTDIRADMSFGIGKHTGIIQLEKLIPLDLVYMYPHNDGVGKIWKDHYSSFVTFLSKFSPKNVLEIGGSNEFVAEGFIDSNPRSTWTIIEPNPIFKGSKNIKIINGWFNNSFKMKSKVDTVVHSHVLEHTYNPFEFLRHVGGFLKTGDRHIFTFPNMKSLLANMYTNCLNFEHTLFLSEDIVEYLLNQTGFKILEKEYYRDHSIFYSTIKCDKNSIKDVKMPRKYKEYKKMFTDYVGYYDKTAKSFNKKMDKFDGKIYLFGAHIFSQHLLNVGLNCKKIICILDNSELKRGKRLYGTDLRVFTPEIIRDLKKVGVVLKAAMYQEEIKKQLLELNPNVVIWE